MRHYIFIVVLISLISFILCDEEPKYKCRDCKKSSKCAQDPENVGIKDCDSKSCLTFIGKKCNTIRRCSTGKEDDGLNEALRPNLTLQCNNKSPADLCNSEIFPADRPRCIISDNGKEVSSPCAIYNETTECFTVEVNNVVTRGCVGDGDSNAEVCTKNADKCIKCTGNYCNKESPLKCYQCSGNDCKRTTLDCKTISEDKIVECKSKGGGCYTLQQGNEVSRGCLSDLVGQLQGLKTCDTGNSCNGGCITDIKKCIKCDSKTNALCGNAAVDDKFSEQCPPYNTACYYCEDQDGILRRGCGDPKNETYSCNYCHEDNCKPDKPQRSCLKCDSSKDGLKCVLGEDFTMSAPCTEIKNDCAVLIKKGTTIRGCAKDILEEKDLPKETFLKCGKHNCNFGVFPADRRRCFQCAKGADCRDEPKGEVSKPCLVYDPQEMCYMYSLKGEMYRGCKSDKSPSSEGCDSNPSTSKNTDKDPCILCDKNDCNRNPYEKHPSLKCIKCKKDDADCIWGQGPEKAVTCEGKKEDTVKYFETEKCYTLVETNGNKTVLQRGCEIDSDACKKPSTECQICEGEMCNKKNFMNFTCIRCRSDNPNEEKCANIGDAIAVVPSPCRNENMQKSEKGCYTDNYNGAIVRGCFADLDLKRRSFCKDKKNNYCNYCEDPNCNNKKAPSSSSINSLSCVFFITSLIAVLLQ